MQLKGQESINRSRMFHLVPGIRLVSGFLLSPTMGALIFYLMLNTPLLFGYKLTGTSLSMSPSFLMGGTILAGTLFYAPAVIIGMVSMVLVRRYYTWNLTTCIIGGVISAFAIASLLLLVILLVGQDLFIAGAGFLMIITLIIIPSVLSGISFWVIAVHNNHGLYHFLTANNSQAIQPAIAGGYVKSVPSDEDCPEVKLFMEPSDDEEPNVDKG